MDYECLEMLKIKLFSRKYLCMNVFIMNTHSKSICLVFTIEKIVQIYIQSSSIKNKLCLAVLSHSHSMFTPLVMAKLQLGVPLCCQTESIQVLLVVNTASFFIFVLFHCNRKVLGILRANKTS